MALPNKDDLVASIERGAEEWVPKMGAHVGDLAFAAYLDINDQSNPPTITFKMNGVRVTLEKI